MNSSSNSVKDNKITHADSTNEIVEVGEIPCRAHTTQQPPIATPTAAPGGENRLTATLTLLQLGLLRITGICSAFGLPEEGDQPQRPYISFTATEVHPTAAIAAEKIHNEETWSFSSLSASRPLPFEERAKPAISFGVQEKSDFSYTNGGTDGEGGSFYGMAPEPEPAEIERKPHVSGNVVTVLIDSGASGHYFDDSIISDLKHRSQDHTPLSTPRTILTAGGVLLDGTAKGVLQGLVTDDYRPARIAS